MELTNKEKDTLTLAFELLSDFYTKQEDTCREFKWICCDHLPQSGVGYVENKNVFDIQDKTIIDLNNKRKEASELRYKILSK